MRHLLQIAVAVAALTITANSTPAYAAVGGNIIINIDIPTVPETEAETSTQEETTPETEPETTAQETETETQPSTEAETTQEETIQESTTTPETKRHHDYDDGETCLPDGDVYNDLVVEETLQDSQIMLFQETTVPETTQEIPQPVLPKMGEENNAADLFWVGLAVAGIVILSSATVYAVRRK